MKILALFAIISSAAFAASFPVSGPAPTEAGYTSLDQAAVAAERAAVHTATDVEEAGGLYQLGNRFYYTEPVTNQEHEEFSIQVAFPVGAKFVGIYHTHPAAWENDQFSGNDVRIANSLNVTSYIGVLGANHVRKYVPGVSESHPLIDSDTMHSMRVSYGTIVSTL